MKKIFLVLVIAASAAVLPSCKKTDSIKGCINKDALNYNSNATEDDGSCVAPLQVHKTVLFDFTGTQCGSCSSVGIPTFMQAIVDNPRTLVPFSVHCGSGDPINNNTSLQFSNDPFYAVSGTPTFAVGNTAGVGINASAVNTAIAANTSSAADAGLAATTTVIGNVANITARVKFFNAVSGEYWLGMYILENGVISPQISLPDPYSHYHVLRACANQTGGIRGQKIANGAVAAGTIIDQSVSYTMSNVNDPSKIVVSLILWKNTSGTWTMVNAW